MNREAELKSLFFKELRHQAPRFLVLLQATAGAPDRAIAGDGKVTTWEFKHATPDFTSKDNQELFCMRLAIQAHCRYVIWWEGRTGLGKKTIIVHPRHVHDRSLLAEASCEGFDQRWLVDQVRRAHR